MGQNNNKFAMTDSTNPSPTPRFVLTDVEARVLATLMEKARTVPDSYPLSLNSLMLGCNQKTSRDPLMELDESQVASAVSSLREQGLVHETAGGRTTKFTHNFQRGVGVYEQAAVLLGMLMLRGPQTAGELRLNTERWYKFADISSVEGFLDELLERSAEKGGPLVIKLPRLPGTREQRWAHLLCGEVDVQELEAGRVVHATGSSGERIEKLEQEVADLRRVVNKLCAELGISPEAAASE